MSSKNLLNLVIHLPPLLSRLLQLLESLKFANILLPGEHPDQIVITFFHSKTFCQHYPSWSWMRRGSGWAPPPPRSRTCHRPTSSLALLCKRCFFVILKRTNVIQEGCFHSEVDNWTSSNTLLSVSVMTRGCDPRIVELFPPLERQQPRVMLTTRMSCLPLSMKSGDGVQGE